MNSETLHKAFRVPDACFRYFQIIFALSTDHKSLEEREGHQSLFDDMHGCEGPARLPVINGECSECS